MPNWSSHLPRLGALALSVVVAAAAYSVYAGQSSTSVNATSSPAAGFADLSPKGELGPAADGGQSGNRAGGGRLQVPSARAGRHASSSAAVVPTSAPAQAVVVAEPELRRPPAPRGPDGADAKPEAGGQSPLDRELERVIDGGPLADPRAPAAPVTDAPLGDQPPDDELGVDSPVVEEPVADEPVDEPIVDDPVVDEPVVDEPAVDDPVVDDPDAGLDDTPVGTLDQTDLGAPVDETGQGASQAATATHTPDKPGP